MVGAVFFGYTSALAGRCARWPDQRGTSLYPCAAFGQKLPYFVQPFENFPQCAKMVPETIASGTALLLINRE